MMKQKIYLIQAHLADTLDADWTVEAMAAQVELSVAHFRKVFKQETGKSPAEYLLDLRLNRAYYLLSDPISDESIKRIRRTVGLNSDSHFSHDFKKKYGQTPTAFRESIYAKYQAERESGKK